jgi:hypothetical protein
MRTTRVLLAVGCAALGLFGAAQAWGDGRAKHESSRADGDRPVRVVERSQGAAKAEGPRHESRDSGAGARENESSGRVAERHSGGGPDDRRGDMRSRSHHGTTVRYYGPSWRGSWWWDPYPYGWGWYGVWGPMGYYYDSPERYRYSATRDQTGALDLDVSPERAEVYVDGRYVGRADDFDGFPTYLWLPKGTYDVVLYREGYETIARQYSIYPGLVIDVEDRMVPGEAKKPEELISKSTVNREERMRRDRERAEAAGAYGDGERWREREEAVGGEGRRRDRVRDQGQEGEGRDAAVLSLEVEPEDAAVYLDGRWLRGGVGRSIELEAGNHTIEVVRPGFRPEKREIQARAGDRLDLVIELKAE